MHVELDLFGNPTKKQIVMFFLIDSFIKVQGAQKSLSSWMSSQ